MKLIDEGSRRERLALEAFIVALLMTLIVLATLWCDADTRIQRLERMVDSIAGSYPDGQFKDGANGIVFKGPSYDVRDELREKSN